MLNWHLTSVDRILKTRNVTEDEDHHNRKQHTWEQQPILRLLVEQRRLLENRQTACSCCKQIEQLHNHQRNKVDATRGIDLFVDKVRSERFLVLAVLQPHGGEWDTLRFEVPERHSEGEKAL